MNEEIKKIIEQLDKRITLHNIIKEPISSDLDKAIKLSVAYEELLNENLKLQQELQQKEDIINKAKEFIKKHNEKAGKLYYKYNNKYLLSEIKEDLLEILNIDKGE